MPPCPFFLQIWRSILRVTLTRNECKTGLVGRSSNSRASAGTKSTCEVRSSALETKRSLADTCCTYIVQACVHHHTWTHTYTNCYSIDVYSITIHTYMLNACIFYIRYNPHPDTYRHTDTQTNTHTHTLTHAHTHTHTHTHTHADYLRIHPLSASDLTNPSIYLSVYTHTCRRTCTYVTLTQAYLPT